MIKLFGAGSSGDGCHVPEADLLYYADGELRSKQAAKIRDHLEACWTCRAKMEGIQNTIADFVDCLNGTLAQEMGPPPRGWQTFRAKLNRVIAQTGEPSHSSQGLSSLRGFIPSSPMFIGLAAGVLLASLIVFLVIPVPRTAANQLIQKIAEAQERRIHAVPQPAVYQKLRVHRASPTPAQDSTVTWELWNDATHDRFRERAEDERGRRFIDPGQGSVAARQRSSHVSRRPSAEQRQRNVTLAGERRGGFTVVPSIIRELDEILRANQMDRRRPLSPLGYDSWRRSIRPVSEEVKNTELADGDRALALTTVASGPFAVNSIIKAALVVRTEDWHAVGQRLEVQGENGVRDYEFIETAYEVVPLKDLNPSVFAEPTPPSPDMQPLQAATASPSLFPSDAELMTAEIEVQYALHHLGACMGGPIEVSREGSGHIRVEGLVQTQERKEQVLAALRGIPFVRAKIQTVAGATASFPAHPESPTNYASPEGARVSRTPTMVEAQSGELPIQDQLRDYFARLNGTAVMGQERGGTGQTTIEQQIIELSNQAVALSLAASAEAAELRRLAERYPPGKTKDLNPTSRWLLEVMVREHAAELKSQLDRAHALLMPVLTAIEIRDSLSTRGKEVPAEVSIGSADPTWQGGALHVFTTTQKICQFIDYFFAGAGLPVGQKEATAQLLTGFDRVEDELRVFQAEVDRSFPGGPDLANKKDQPQ